MTPLLKNKLSAKHEGPLLTTKDNFDIIDCQLCGFIHVSPLPSEKELSDYYARKFYESSRKINYFEAQKKDQKWWHTLFDERLELFEKNLENKGRILDIGCGPGFFLERAKQKNWEIYGIDPSNKAVEHANRQLGLDVYCKNFEELEADEIGGFDVIYSHGVLEHLRNPNAFFEKAKSLLNPGGLIFSSIANEFNPFQMVAWKTLKMEPWWLCPPEHINYFNVDSIKQVYKNHNLEITSCVTSFPIDIFLLMGENYIGNDTIGASCHNKRKAFEKALKQSENSELINDLYKSFADLGLGRQCDILGKMIK